MAAGFLYKNRGEQQILRLVLKIRFLYKVLKGAAVETCLQPFLRRGVKYDFNMVEVVVGGVGGAYQHLIFSYFSFEHVCLCCQTSQLFSVEILI